MNWALGLGFLPRPLLLADKVFLYGFTPVFCFAIPPMVVYDCPRDRQIIYQAVLVVAIWMWSVYQLIFMLVLFRVYRMTIMLIRSRYLCGQYNPAHSRFQCGNKDYLTLF